MWHTQATQREYERKKFTLPRIIRTHEINYYQITSRFATLQLRKEKLYPLFFFFFIVIFFPCISLNSVSLSLSPVMYENLCFPPLRHTYWSKTAAFFPFTSVVWINYCIRMGEREREMGMERNNKSFLMWHCFQLNMQQFFSHWFTTFPLDSILQIVGCIHTHNGTLGDFFD